MDITHRHQCHHHGHGHGHWWDVGHGYGHEHEPFQQQDTEQVRPYGVLRNSGGVSQKYRRCGLSGMAETEDQCCQPCCHSLPWKGSREGRLPLQSSDHTRTLPVQLGRSGEIGETSSFKYVVILHGMGRVAMNSCVPFMGWPVGLRLATVSAKRIEQDLFFHCFHFVLFFVFHFFHFCFSFFLTFSTCFSHVFSPCFLSNSIFPCFCGSVASMSLQLRRAALRYHVCNQVTCQQPCTMS